MAFDLPPPGMLPSVFTEIRGELDAIETATGNAAVESDISTLQAKTALLGVASGTMTITIGSGKNLIITSLPTSDPGVAGALYVSTGAVKVSAGGG